MFIPQVHVHGNDLTSLHKLVPKQCLPTEMGGESGTIQENFGKNIVIFSLNFANYNMVSMDSNFEKKYKCVMF